ncbi:hypothetical protein J6590_081293 [Homalodisca vitripennis]|nr:hypothetical protein J6590_081293 [Homalodisca vitripennis]
MDNLVLHSCRTFLIKFGRNDNVHEDEYFPPAFCGVFFSEPHWMREVANQRYWTLNTWCGNLTEICTTTFHRLLAKFTVNIREQTNSGMRLTTLKRCVKLSSSQLSTQILGFNVREIVRKFKRLNFRIKAEPPRAKLGCRSFYDVNNLLLLQTEPPRAKLGCRSFYDVNDLLLLQTELPRAKLGCPSLYDVNNLILLQTEPPRAKLGYRSLYDVNNLILLQTESPRAKLGCPSLYDVNNLILLQTEPPRAKS